MYILFTVRQPGRAQADYDADDNSEADDDDDDDGGDDGGDERRQLYSYDSCSPAADCDVTPAAWSVPVKHTESTSSRHPVYIDNDGDDVDMKVSSDTEDISLSERAMMRRPSSRVAYVDDVNERCTDAAVRRPSSRVTYVDDGAREHRAVKQYSSDRMQRGNADAAARQQVTDLSSL